MRLRINKSDNRRTIYMSKNFNVKFGMKSKIRKGLVKNFMLVTCSDPKHSNCNRITPKILDIPYTMEAYTTSVNLNKSDYCIALTAVTSPSEVESLQEQILKIRTKNPALHITKIKTYTDTLA